MHTEDNTVLEILWQHVRFISFCCNYYYYQR